MYFFFCLQDVEIYLGTEMRKEADVVNVRLENIKLKNKLRKKEQQLKSKVLECPKDCYICTCIPVLIYFR